MTEIETPTSSDYLSANVTHNEAKISEVGFPALTGLAGITGLSASAWIYTASSGSVELEVQNSAHRLTLKSFNSIGWHSLALSITKKNLEDGELSFKLNSTSTSGLRQVYAAAIKLSFEPASPMVYWGSWMDGDVYGGGLGDAPWDKTTWEIFESHTKKAVSIVHFGQPAPWTQIFQEAPLSLSRERGSIPLMDMGSNGATLGEIASKERDVSLRSWAKDVAKYGYPFFFRWNWEMNGTWYGWGKEAAISPSLFRDAWRHFHDIAVEAGATNITWVWCPNVIFTGSTELKALYPGDEYVDWTCLDGYNHGTNPIDPLPSHPGNGSVAFRSLFESSYNSLLSIAPNKPIMIGETASTEYGSSKAQWIRQALATDLPSSFPKIKAVNWFNWNHPDESGETELSWDWPIESSLSSETAFSEGIASPYYAANTFGNLPSLSPIEPLP